MKSYFSRLIVMLVCCLLTNPARAAGPMIDSLFTLTTTDFSERPVTLVAMNDSVVTILTADLKQQDVPLADVVQLTRVVPRADTTAGQGLVLALARGDRLIGTPRRIQGQSIVWAVPGMGDLSVPIEQTLGILRDATFDARLTETRAEDEITLATGDVLRGIVTDVSPASISLMPTGGAAQAVALESVVRILLASPPGGRPESKAAPITVRLNSQSVIGCAKIELSGNVLTLTPLDGRPIKTTLDAIESIEHTGGKVSWLSARTPTLSQHTPFFSGAFPARFDRTVTGGPLRFGSQTFARGIGVHSRSKLVYALSPGDAVFRTRFAIDPAFGYANVDVRVRLDDKIVHETKGFGAGVMSDVLSLPINDAKTFTLEVDFGQGYDVQDRLMWIEPAIVVK